MHCKVNYAVSVKMIMPEPVFLCETWLASARQLVRIYVYQYQYFYGLLAVRLQEIRIYGHDSLNSFKIDEESAEFFCIEDQSVVLVVSEALGPDSMRCGAGERLVIGNELPE